MTKQVLNAKRAYSMFLLFNIFFGFLGIFQIVLSIWLSPDLGQIRFVLCFFIS